MYVLDTYNGGVFEEVVSNEKFNTNYGFAFYIKY